MNTVPFDEFKRRKRERDLEQLKIPAFTRGKRLTDLEVHPGNRNAIASTENWLLNARRHWPKGDIPGKGLLYVGKPGAGKTLLAAIVAQEITRRGGAAHFMRMSAYERLRSRKIDLSRLAKDSDDDSWDEYQQVVIDLDRLYTAPLLVLDDVGQEYGGDYTVKGLQDVIRSRYDAGRPTIITSNVPPDEWGAGYGPAMQSFIQEAFVIIPVVGKDFRATR